MLLIVRRFFENQINVFVINLACSVVRVLYFIIAATVYISAIESARAKTLAIWIALLVQLVSSAISFDSLCLYQLLHCIDSSTNRCIKYDHCYYIMAEELRRRSAFML